MNRHHQQAGVYTTTFETLNMASSTCSNLTVVQRYDSEECANDPNKTTVDEMSGYLFLTIDASDGNRYTSHIGEFPTVVRSYRYVRLECYSSRKDAEEFIRSSNANEPESKHNPLCAEDIFEILENQEED